jgi:signal transduction histidine kinase
VPDLSARAAHGLDLIAPEARSALIVPLGFRGRAPGVLVGLDSLGEDGGFDADAVDLLSSFAASAAIAIATAQSVGAERLRHSLRASEAERGRWARELHDETLQELGALKMLLDTARQSQDADRIRESIEHAADQIELSIRNLQALITELRPAALDQIGLVPALDALMKRMAATSGVEIDADIAAALEEGTRPNPEVEGTLYRLVQESLTNAIKHGSPGKVSVTLASRGDCIDVTVADDGSGFEIEEPSAGFGLIGMQERVGLVGGTLSVESIPGEGTTVRAEVPIRG